MNFKSKFLFAIPVIVTILIVSSSFKKQTFDLKASIERGKDLYIVYCLSCHMDSGEGMQDMYPPLAKSDYMMADKKRSIQQVLYGMDEEITVNGEKYNTKMDPVDLKDEEASDVLNYVRNSFGNKGEAVTPEEVKAARK